MLNGSLCLKYKCFKCCLETEMVLSYSDLYRIINLGYELDEFSYFDGNYWRLKNSEGKCYFLSTDGRCRIYNYRPKGCRVYPIIIVESEEGIKCVVDNYCPLAEMITLDELNKGCKKLIKLLREIGNF